MKVAFLVVEDPISWKKSDETFFDDGFAEAEDQKYALTEQGLGSNIFHVDYDDVKTLLSRLQKEVLAELVEAKK